MGGRSYPESLLAFGEHNPKYIEIVGLLKDFLETADLKKLCAKPERHLVEGRYVKFIVYAEGGVPKYEMRISPEPRGNSGKVTKQFSD
jgi:hypothetical protein